jgi:hypothetical protein
LLAREAMEAAGVSAVSSLRKQVSEHKETTFYLRSSKFPRLAAARKDRQEVAG